MQTIYNLIERGDAIRGVPVILNGEPAIVSHQSSSGSIVLEEFPNQEFDSAWLEVDYKRLSEMQRLSS